MHVGIYAHPWDLEDLPQHGGLARLAELGFRDVALATAYHAGRWFTPWSSQGPVRFLEDGIVHFRPRGSYGELEPLCSRDVPEDGPSPLEKLIHDARDVGIETHAWTVLFHNTRLGSEHPELCVTNAFGDAYTYALCPSNGPVRDYGRTIVRDLASHDGLDVIELEAVGFMGHKHGSHHDKSSFASEPFTDFLLSYCFCDECMQGLGSGAEAIRGRVAALIGEHRLTTDAMSAVPTPRDEVRGRLTAALGDDALEALLAHRSRVQRGVLTELRDAVAERTRLSLHMAFDELFTGSQLGAPLERVESLVDEVIVTHYGESIETIDAAWEGQPTDRVPARAAIWPRAPQFRSESDIAKLCDVLERRSARGVRIYHLGLLPWPTLERVARALPH